MRLVKRDSLSIQAMLATWWIKWGIKGGFFFPSWPTPLSMEKSLVSICPQSEVHCTRLTFSRSSSYQKAWYNLSHEQNHKLTLSGCCLLATKAINGAKWDSIEVCNLLDRLGIAHHSSLNESAHKQLSPSAVSPHVISCTWPSAPLHAYFVKRHPL